MSAISVDTHLPVNDPTAEDRDKAPKARQGDLDKKKYLVPSNLTIGQYQIPLIQVRHVQLQGNRLGKIKNMLISHSQILMPF